MTFTFKPPEGYIWEEVSYPSFSFSKEKDWNFFYSGTIGLNLICYNFLSDSNSNIIKGMSFLSLFNVPLQSFLFLITRSHYSIDVFSNILIAQYFVYASDLIDPYLQRIYRLNKDEAVAASLSNEELRKKKK